MEVINDKLRNQLMVKINLDLLLNEMDAELNSKVSNQLLFQLDSQIDFEFYSNMWIELHIKLLHDMVAIINESK